MLRRAVEMSRRNRDNLLFLQQLCIFGDALLTA
jgi:hypothetical protein